MTTPRRSGSETGNGRNKNASMTLKTATLAPMPRPRLATATEARPGRRAIHRSAQRKSCSMDILEIILHSSNHRKRWDARPRSSDHGHGNPSSALQELLPDLRATAGSALDVACGAGAIARLPAHAGYTVGAIVWSFEALSRLRDHRKQYSTLFEANRSTSKERPLENDASGLPSKTCGVLFRAGHRHRKRHRQCVFQSEDDDGLRGNRQLLTRSCCRGYGSDTGTD